MSKTTMLRRNEEQDDMKSGTRRRVEQFWTGFTSSDDTKCDAIGNPSKRDNFYSRKRFGSPNQDNSRRSVFHVMP